MGLAGEQTSVETLNRLLPTIRADVYYESDQIKDADFPNFYRIRESDAPENNASTLAEFLDIAPAQALDLAANEHLFAD